MFRLMMLRKYIFTQFTEKVKNKLKSFLTCF